MSLDAAAAAGTEAGQPAAAPRPRPALSAWERQSRRTTLSLLVLPVLAMPAMFVTPLVVLMWMSVDAGDGTVTLDGYRGLMAPVYLRLLGFTLELSFWVTAACAAPACPIAYMMANIPGRFAKWMAVSLFISLRLSFLARTFSWIVILQRNGVVNDILTGTGLISSPLRLVYNETGVYIGLIHILPPFMIITLVPGMKAIDPAYARAALSLGASPFKAFRQVYLPLSAPGLAAGAMLVFILAFGFFITPAILGGGRTPTITLAIRDQIQELGDLQLAAATAMALLVICLAILPVFNRVAGVDRIYKGKS
ncbi:ABC transporter permease [Rhodovulum sp. DZ06]|uniref:ABC transporter permease n=1 Tax=Rhodovulum sp. DZ06 TaxID=3425126 RepID=UPI003D347ADA